MFIKIKPNSQHISRAILWLCLLLLIACGNGEEEATNAPTAVVPTPRPFMTLAPTFTPLSGESLLVATATPYNTPVPIPTPVETSDFNKTVIEFRYRIPAIGLDRRIEGKAGSQILIIDEVTQAAFQRNNQGSILLELQQVLPTLVLEPLPEGCTTCVQFEFSLPLSDIQQSGWLTDIRVLASVENYLSAILGPHFPPNTQVGLRRNATSFYPAHTLAITDSGDVWLWFSIEPQINQPTFLTGPLPPLPSTNQLQTEYATPCLGMSGETLFLRNLMTVDLTCPAYTMPTSLQPLYIVLDNLIAPQLATLPALPEQPPFGFPLAGVVQYQRIDGKTMTILQDNTVQIQQDGILTRTFTLTNTSVVNLATELLSTGELQLGLNSFPDTIGGDETPTAPQYRVLVRAEAGVYDGAWSTAVSFLQPLDTLIDEQFITPTAPIVTTPPLTPTLTLEPTVTVTTTVESTPEP